MPAITLNSSSVNRSQRREESRLQTLVKKSEVQKAAKYTALALTAVGAAAMLYSVASSGPGPGPVPTPVKDFLKNRVSFPKLSTLVPGICPIADRYSEWTIMKLLNQRVTYGVFYLTEQARETSYATYPNPDDKDTFRYGTTGGAHCIRREWLKDTTDSVWHNLIEKSDHVFKFTRSTDYGSYPHLEITCASKDDTLTCNGTVVQPKAPLHPTPLDGYYCEYTATETKSGSITETLKAKGGDTIQETNKAPVLLHQLLYFDQKV